MNIGFDHLVNVFLWGHAENAMGVTEVIDFKMDSGGSSAFELETVANF
jgi:hypothetical protein